MYSSRPSDRRGAGRRTGRGALAFLLRLVLFALLFVAVGEVWFRTAMPACETPDYYQDSEWRVQRYQPGAEGEFSFGRLTQGRTQWSINNDGWPSAVDYLPAAERDGPLIALFGDSQIEGFYTTPQEHIDPLLAEELGSTVDAYAFGGSGWQVEQFVATSRYVRAAYSPDLLVVFIARNDVAFSLVGGGQSWGAFWRITLEGAGFKEVPPRPLDTGRRSLSQAAKWSALLNYLRFNAKLSLPGGGEGIPVGDAPSDAETGDAGSEQAGAASRDDSWRELLPAARFMLGRLREENPGVPVIVAVDGDRYLRPEQVATTPLYPDALAIQAACQGLAGFYFVDLRETFSSDWVANSQRFEAVDGFHWNAYANRLIARTLATYIEEKDLLRRSGEDGL